MTIEDPTPGCSPGGFCGICPTPCFLKGSDAFESLVEQGPEGFDELTDSLDDTDTAALACLRWDEPGADCKGCEGNYFCFVSFTTSI